MTTSNINILDLFSVSEAARHVRKTPNYLRILARAGKIRHFRKGKRIFFKRYDLDTHFLLIPLPPMQLELDLGL